jgi:LacI family transcriptional regulator
MMDANTAASNTNKKKPSGDTMATMEDVARAADVSLSTVSHVLNGTRKVSPKTVAAVNAAMQQIGYVPNMLARALAGSSSGTIGVAISAFTNHYFSETVRAIEAACTRHGLMMLFSDTHDDPEQELKVVQNLHQRRVDGIVLAPSGDAHNRALAYLTSTRSPPCWSTACRPSLSTRWAWKTSRRLANWSAT